MRLRREAYRASSVFRHQQDRAPMDEPQRITDIPD
jgi:hypothetical protein